MLRRVSGSSMEPTLPAGKLVLAWRKQLVKPGQIVLVQHQGLEKIKRVQAIAAGQVYVVGDNPDPTQSTDSRSFGWLDQSAVIARVVWPVNR